MAVRSRGDSKVGNWDAKATGDWRVWNLGAIRMAGCLVANASVRSESGSSKGCGLARG